MRPPCRRTCGLEESSQSGRTAVHAVAARAAGWKRETGMVEVLGGLEQANGCPNCQSVVVILCQSKRVQVSHKMGEEREHSGS